MDGNLGSGAKIYKRSEDYWAIYFYTNDYANLDDVDRVLNEISDLDLKNTTTGIYYKTELYSICHIDGSNRWSLRASKYEA